LAAIAMAVAIWVTMGSPPKAHPVTSVGRPGLFSEVMAHD
jgi:hypothetical protein